MPRAGGFFIIAFMSEEFSISFESPQSGWMSLRLRAAEREFVAVASHRPYDSLRDTLIGLASLLEEGGRFAVRWNTEPEEFDFDFAAAGERARLRVTRLPVGRREGGEDDSGEEVFICESTLKGLCRPFCEELRDLRARGEADEFERNWRRPFPNRELRRLCDALDAGSSDAGAR